MLLVFRRNGLRTALGGRSEKSLTVLLQYLSKYINDPRFSRFLMEITDIVLGQYQYACLVKFPIRVLHKA